MKPVNSKTNSMFSGPTSNSVGDGGGPSAADLEVRPGGMMVQKRDTNQCSQPVPTITVRVKYGSSYHEIRISSQASFGELKKMLAEPTGLYPLDQKLIFKNKERDSKAYLDAARVKDGSKIVLVEDIESRERRCLEMLKNAKVEKASKSLAEISLDVDKLSGQVTALEAAASRDGEVSDTEVDNLTEMFMAKLVRLEGLLVQGEQKLQRMMQVRRVQNQIETLDALKLKYSKIRSQQQAHSSRKMPIPMQKQQAQLRQRDSREGIPQLRQLPRHSDSVVVTTKWETFD